MKSWLLRSMLAAWIALAPLAAVAQPPQPAYVSGNLTTGGLVKGAGNRIVQGGDASGDCSTSGLLVFTCLKTNGVNFGTFATQNYAAPPAIGGTTPAAGSFTTGSFTGNLTTNVTGSTQCVQANSLGVLGGTGSACGSGATGMALLATATISGSSTNTITFSAISQSYSHLELIVVGRDTNTSGSPDRLGLIFNGDTTSAHYPAAAFWFAGANGTNPSGSYGFTAGDIAVSNGSNTYPSVSTFEIFAYSQSSLPVAFRGESITPPLSGNRANSFTSGMYEPSALAAITSLTVTVLTSSYGATDYVSGTKAWLYGY